VEGGDALGVGHGLGVGDAAGGSHPVRQSRNQQDEAEQSGSAEDGQQDPRVVVVNVEAMRVFHKRIVS
jgi:hypothetical protein